MGKMMMMMMMMMVVVVVVVEVAQSRGSRRSSGDAGSSNSSSIHLDTPVPLLLVQGSTTGRPCFLQTCQRWQLPIVWEMHLPDYDHDLCL